MTMVLKCSIEMHTMGYAWRGLKEQLGEEVDDKVSAMRFLKGKTVRSRREAWGVHAYER